MHHSSRRGTRTLAIVSVIAVLIVAISIPGMAQKKKKGKDARNEGISLVWSPTTELGELGAVNLTGIADKKIQISLTDSREEGELIGENVEDDEPKLVTTPDDIAAFVEDHVNDLFELLGLTTVDSGGDARVEVELRRFFCAEDSTYVGDVGLRVKLADASGEELWIGLANGSETRWGRSYKDENYFECLSDSLVEAVHGLITNSAFRDALAGL